MTFIAASRRHYRDIQILPDRLAVCLCLASSLRSSGAADWPLRPIRENEFVLSRLRAKNFTDFVLGKERRRRAAAVRFGAMLKSNDVGIDWMGEGLLRSI